jgi:hypothetical protein
MRRVAAQAIDAKPQGARAEEGGVAVDADRWDLGRWAAKKRLASDMVGLDPERGVDQVAEYHAALAAISIAETADSECSCSSSHEELAAEEAVGPSRCGSRPRARRGCISELCPVDRLRLPRV